MIEISEFKKNPKSFYSTFEIYAEAECLNMEYHYESPPDVLLTARVRTDSLAIVRDNLNKIVEEINKVLNENN